MSTPKDAETLRLEQAIHADLQRATTIRRTIANHEYFTKELLFGVYNNPRDPRFTEDDLHKTQCELTELYVKISEVEGLVRGRARQLRTLLIEDWETDAFLHAFRGADLRFKVEIQFDIARLGEVEEVEE